MLREVARMFREEPQKIEQNRAALMARLAATARPNGRAVIGAAELDNAALQLGGLIDPVNGGTRGAPKFPQAALFELLWRAGLRSPLSRQRGREGRASSLRSRSRSTISAKAASTTISAAASPATRSTSAGSCRISRRCSTTTPSSSNCWRIAYQKTGKPLYRQRARETVEWLKREMTSADGAFSASLDADSEGEEGKFYVWSYDEVMRELGVEDGEFFARHYDVTPAGNFEGHNILNRLNPQPRSDDDDARLAALRTKLLGVRDARIRPGLDDKVLADWNGLMIAALANASLLFAEPSWLDTAARAFAFIARAMTRGDRLGHSWREDKLKFPGLASDFAAMIRAALALYESTGRPSYLERALTWQHALDRDYANAETGTYYLTAADAEGLVIRPAATTDEATPNHNAVAAQNLIRLALLAGDQSWREKADRLIAAIAPLVTENLYMHVALLNAVDLRLRAAEIVVTGEGEGAEALLAAARALPALDRIVLHARSPESLPRAHPAQEKVRAASTAQAFVCIGETCSLPVTDPAGLIGAVESTRRN